MAAAVYWSLCDGCRNLRPCLRRRRNGVQASTIELRARIRGGGPARQLQEGGGGAQHHRQRGEPRRAESGRLARRCVVSARRRQARIDRARRRLCGRGRRSVESGRRSDRAASGAALAGAACDQLRTRVSPPAGCCRDCRDSPSATRKPAWTSRPRSRRSTCRWKASTPPSGLRPLRAPCPSWTRLLDESLVPVCSPSLLEKYAGLSGLELIASADLIHMTSVSGDWAEWFRIVGAAPPANVRAGLRVDTANMALEAARRGYGIALGRTPLFDAEIKSGAACQFVRWRAERLVLLARDHGCGFSEPGCERPSGNGCWMSSAVRRSQAGEQKPRRKIACPFRGASWSMPIRTVAARFSDKDHAATPDQSKPSRPSSDLIGSMSDAVE